VASDKDDKGIVDGIEIDDDGDGKPDRFLGRDIFNEMYGIATQVGSSPDDSNYARIISEKLLDLEGFIDYMLINFYIGNSDWDRGNWYALRHRYRPDKGFRFLCWDAETALIDVYDNKVSMRDGEPTKILAGLKNNPEFRLLFADRVYKHLFNGGLLTPEAAAARYEKLASEIEKPLIAESARWGDYRKMNNETTVVYTPNDHWKPRKESLLKDYFPQRTAILLQQLKDEGFYPSLEAPVFSKRGGEYYSRSKLGISAGAGQIYYTLDGTDPRVPIVSGVSESAIRYSDSISLDQSYILVKARVLNGSTWSALAEAAYTYRDTVTQLSGLSVPPEDIYFARGCLHYNLPLEGSIRVEIFLPDGRKVLTSHEPNAVGHRSLDCSELRPGLYIYRMYYSGTVYLTIFSPLR
jgi:hypothetical protein